MAAAAPTKGRQRGGARGSGLTNMPGEKTLTPEQLHAKRVAAGKKGAAAAALKRQQQQSGGVATPQRGSSSQRGAQTFTIPWQMSATQNNLFTDVIGICQQMETAALNLQVAIATGDHAAALRYRTAYQTFWSALQQLGGNILAVNVLPQGTGSGS